MVWIPAEFQDVPLRDPRMLQQLPARVRQSRSKRTALVRRKFLQRIHELHVRRSALQQIHQMLAQRSVAACGCIFSATSFRARALLALRLRSCLFLQADFSDTTICCGISGTGCSVDFANPALRNIFSYSEKV